MPIRHRKTAPYQEDTRANCRSMSGISLGISIAAVYSASLDADAGLRS